MKSRLICIGDVHGAFEQLLQIIAACPKDADIWQLGDFVCEPPDNVAIMNINIGSGPGESSLYGKNFKFLRGNHDKPGAAIMHPNYAGAYGYEPKHRMFYMSGAPATSLVDASPELATEQLEAAYRKYVETKPEVVLTHTAPSGIVVMICKDMGKKRDYEAHSRTSQALQRMLMAHQPRFWIFGHFHADWQRVLTTHGGKQTQFVCCDRLREGQNAKVFLVPEEFNAPGVGEIIHAPASA